MRNLGAVAHFTQSCAGPDHVEQTRMNLMATSNAAPFWR